MSVLQNHLEKKKKHIWKVQYNQLKHTVTMTNNDQRIFDIILHP